MTKILNFFSHKISFLKNFCVPGPFPQFSLQKPDSCLTFISLLRLKFDFQTQLQIPDGEELYIYKILYIYREYAMDLVAYIEYATEIKAYWK